MDTPWPGIAERKRPPSRDWLKIKIWAVMAPVVVVLVLSGYISSETDRVQQRKAWLSKNWSPEWMAAGRDDQFATGDPVAGPSLVRTWIGDRPESAVWLPASATEYQRSAAASLFPEADVYILPKPLFEWVPKRGWVPAER